MPHHPPRDASPHARHARLDRDYAIHKLLRVPYASGPLPPPAEFYGLLLTAGLGVPDGNASANATVGAGPASGSGSSSFYGLPPAAEGAEVAEGVEVPGVAAAARAPAGRGEAAGERGEASAAPDARASAAAPDALYGLGPGTLYGLGQEPAHRGMPLVEGLEDAPRPLKTAPVPFARGDVVALACDAGGQCPGPASVNSSAWVQGPGRAGCCPSRCSLCQTGGHAADPGLL